MFDSHEWEVLLDLVSDGILITDHECNIVKVNKAYERMAKRTAQELIGTNINNMEWRKNNESSAVKVLQTRKPVTTIQQVVVDHEKKEFISTGMPMFNEQNEIIYVVNCVRDMTELHELKRALEQIKQMNQTYLKQLKSLKERELHLEGLVAHSKEMIDVLTVAAKVATVDSQVILRGESGVGKEVIAKFIHKNSMRACEAFIKVNCGAIPEALMESEFFGYESGAFTGANREGKPGVFELANHGTLFLDEIGDMPLDLQVKLLRVLEEQEFRRVGGVKTIRSDVRIIAATNQNLEEMVQRKAFRKDLYYRLQVYPIHIPPLRKRREDIPYLIQYFLEAYQKKRAIQFRIDPDVIQLLCQYDWPGNIRELSNVIERMAITSSNKDILIEHVPQEIFGNFRHIMPECLQEEVELFEYQKLTRALALHKSTRKAALALKMSQPTFVRKMKLYEQKYRTDLKMDHLSSE
ncbi:MAG TPA: sigma 54-interacting transcriptional regulator [Candidatus Bathyarchaeia archaeon]|nr:sigma 54-interacting transcriptional regulator [Candidatus Bathyarchaeia archaeon]